MPPEYPDVALMTPSSSSKMASVHQKHPLAKVAVCMLAEIEGSFVSIVLLFIFIEVVTADGDFCAQEIKVTSPKIADVSDVFMIEGFDFNI